MFMFRYFIAIIVCSLTFSELCIANTSAVYYRSFWSPLYQGHRLDYCSLNHRECGLPIAHRYCQMLGYEKAVRAIIDYNVGLTHFLATRHQCKGWTCNGFMLIRCAAKMRHKPVREYYYRAKKFILPRYQHYRVAWCYQKGKGCGQKAAFSFCRRMGYTKTIEFHQQKKVLATREIGDKRLCFGDTCRGFSSITCYR